MVPERCQNSSNPLNTREIENPSTQSFSLKRRVVFFQMVEAAGVEPASENDHPRLLHTYLRIWVSSSGLL